MVDDDDPSGFKEDQKKLELASTGPGITSIRLGEGISPTRILVDVEREDGSTKEETASIELVNLCRYDAGDDVYDPESKKLDYSELGRDIRMRTDALLGHRLESNSLFGTNRLDKSPSDLRGELTDDSEDEDEGPSASDLLRQERDRD